MPDCVAAKGAAQSNAKDNGALDGAAPTDGKFHTSLTTNDCGTWTPPAKGGTDGFSADDNNPNAVKVIAGGPVPSIWGFAGALPNVSAEAVATLQPSVAVFSVTPTLATANGGLLGTLLKSIGLSTTASVASYDGIAKATVTPGGLLGALGIKVPANITIGDLNKKLASISISVSDILDKTVTLAGEPNLVDANADLLKSINAKLSAKLNDVTLGTNSNGNLGTLFAKITTGNDSTPALGALNAKVNALDIIYTSLAIATAKHAITVPNLTVTLPAPLNIASVTTSVSVIEPPSIGIGGKGTKAYSAQVRILTRTEIDTSKLPILGILLNLKIDIPITTDLVNSEAEINDLCNSRNSENKDLASISATSSVLNICVGNNTPDQASSTSQSCKEIVSNNGNIDVLSLSALSLIQVAKLTIQPFSTSVASVTDSGNLYEGQYKDIPEGGNPLLLGSTIKNLMTELTNSIANAKLTLGPGFDLLNVLNVFGKYGQNLLSSVLALLQVPIDGTASPLLDNVGSSLTSDVLQPIAGVKLETSTVHLQSLQCHRVQLVY